MTTPNLKFLLVVSSVREGRLAERMIKLVQRSFDTHLKPKGHTLSVLDPDDYDLPVLKQPLHFYPDPSKAPECLQKLGKVVKEADAYIILTAEYNRSMPPALVNTLDHVPPASLEFKASGIIAYSMGPTGGCFAISACRPFLAEMGCLPIKMFSAIGVAHKEVNEQGVSANAHVNSSVQKTLTQLEWWALTLKEGRAKRAPPS